MNQPNMLYICHWMENSPFCTLWPWKALIDPKINSVHLGPVSYYYTQLHKTRSFSAWENEMKMNFQRQGGIQVKSLLQLPFVGILGGWWVMTSKCVCVCMIHKVQCCQLSEHLISDKVIFGIFWPWSLWPCQGQRSRDHTLLLSEGY